MSLNALRLEVSECSIAFRLTNETALKIFKEKTLLDKPFFETVNSYIPQGIPVPESLRSSVETRFRSFCTSVDTKHRKMKGRARAGFLKKERYVNIAFDNESSIHNPHNQTIKDIIIQALEEEVKRMEGAARQSISELTKSIRDFEVKCLQLEEKNRSLSSQAENSRLLHNCGKMVGEGSKSTDKRKLHSAGSAIVQALEKVLESYGLNICQVVVADLRGLLHKISFSDSDGISVARGIKREYRGNGQIDYQNLSSPDKKTVREIAALLDNHFVSNVFWEKISSTVPNLPSLHLINSYRRNLDENTVVFKTPGKSAGAQVSFVRELKNAISEFAANRGMSGEELRAQPILVKIEGDGCVVSKQTNWTTLSFLLIDSGRRLQSHRLHRLLAVVEIPENYFQIREALKDLIEEVNSVANKGSVNVEGQDVPVIVCLGSDLKFLLMVQGMQSASSRYPCPFCRANLKQRSSAAATTEEFNEPPLLRTLKNMREDCLAEEHGMKAVPLFNIDPAFVIPDILHMRIRLVNRLIDGLIVEAMDRDNRDKVINLSSKNTHVEAIVGAINSCGVKFEVWEDERKGKNFTSIQGDACKRLFNMLPERLTGKLDQQTENKVISLWKMISRICDHFEHNVTGASIEQETTEFHETFLKLGELGQKGYGAERVTPYMHILACHASKKHENFKCLGWFSSEGVEKKKTTFLSICIMQNPINGMLLPMRSNWQNALKLADT